MATAHFGATPLAEPPRGPAPDQLSSLFPAAQRRPACPPGVRRVVATVAPLPEARQIAVALNSGSYELVRGVLAYLRATRSPATISRVIAWSSMFVNARAREQLWVNGDDFADEPDMRLLHAQVCLTEAWARRGRLPRSEVPDEDLAVFHDTLNRAEELVLAAVDARSDDPAPWTVMIQWARGLGAGRARVHDAVAGLAATGPDHLPGHWQALVSLSARWGGSTREVLDFTADAVQAAPAGSAVQALAVVAELELFADVMSHRHRESHVASQAQQERALERQQATEVAERWLHDTPDADPLDVSELLNVLAVVYALDGREDEARHALVAMGPSVQLRPWSYFGDPEDAHSWLVSRLFSPAAPRSVD